MIVPPHSRQNSRIIPSLPRPQLTLKATNGRLKCFNLLFISSLGNFPLGLPHVPKRGSLDGCHCCRLVAVDFNDSKFQNSLLLVRN